MLEKLSHIKERLESKNKKRHEKALCVVKYNVINKSLLLDERLRHSTLLH